MLSPQDPAIDGLGRRSVAAEPAEEHDHEADQRPSSRLRATILLGRPSVDPLAGRARQRVQAIRRRRPPVWADEPIRLINSKMLDSIRVAAIGPREEQNAQVRDGDLDRDGHDGLDELLHRGTGSIRLLARLLFRVLVRDVGRPRGLALWRRASVGTRTS